MISENLIFEPEELLKYREVLQRQQLMRNYAHTLTKIGTPIGSAVPAPLEVMINYLYNKEIKTLKFNDIALEQSIYDSIRFNSI